MIRDWPGRQAQELRHWPILLMSDAREAGAVLAEPRYVIVGDETVTERYTASKPIPSQVLAEYAQRLRDEGHIPEVETRYSELMEAIRRARLQRRRPSR